MEFRHFDALTRTFARAVPRRSVVARTAAGVAAWVAGSQALTAAAQPARQTPGPDRTLTLPCEQCNCDDNGCDCCLAGITGGGVVKTERGDVNFVLFATRLGSETAQSGAGFVRWIDPHVEGGMTLESVGPIDYKEDAANEQARVVSGSVKVNGSDQQPFILNVAAGGADPKDKGSAHVRVGDSAAEAGATTSGFGYESQGKLVGGDLQLLSTVAPISQSG